MDDRIVEFVRGLRAAGVRVSLAESVDAMHAVQTLGISNKKIFQESLRATLVKESDDFAAFDELFPLYFGSGGPPLPGAAGGPMVCLGPDAAIGFARRCCRVGEL